MLKIDEAKKANGSFMIPERDTNTKVKAKVTGGSMRPVVKAKGKVEVRINTGLRKGKKEEPTITKLRESVKSRATVKVKTNSIYNIFIRIRKQCTLFKTFTVS